MAPFIFIIIGLIAGYFFITKFKKIDNALFSSIENYQPFGIQIVYISAFMGALFGCLFMYGQIVDSEMDLKPIMALMAVFFSVMVSTSVFQAFIYLDSAGSIIGKSIFMIVSCALALAIGAAGSIVIICLAIIYIVLLVIGKATLGDYGKRYTTTDEYGNKRTLRSEGNGNYRDDQGRSWTAGDSPNTVTRDD